MHAATHPTARGAQPAHRFLTPRCAARACEGDFAAPVPLEAAIDFRTRSRTRVVARPAALGVPCMAVTAS